MKLLCIGQSGQVARALQSIATTQSLNLIAKGRPEVDLASQDSLSKIIREFEPDCVINAAAYTAVDQAESDREQAFALNCDGPKALAELCADRALPLIHISTDYVFDGSGEHAFRETDTPYPINTYGQSKYAGESALAAVLDQHVILRTSWVYGPYGSNFVKTMLRLAREKESASVVDDQIGSPTHAHDIASAILEIARQTHRMPSADKLGTFHFAAKGYASWADVAALIFEIYEQRTGCKIALKRIPSSDYPTPAARPKNSRLDTHKLTDVFGIMPTPWQVGVRETVNQLMDEGN